MPPETHVQHAATRSVACSLCQARPGSPCLSMSFSSVSKGTPLTWHHAVRRAAAPSSYANPDNPYSHVTLTKVQLAALVDWAKEAARPNGTSGWGPKFVAALKVAQQVREASA